MTKTEFLSWLEQYRHISNIRTVVEQRTWSGDELYRLKETLQNGGQLKMKNEFKRRMAWG
jgi:hypothetical protein